MKSLIITTMASLFILSSYAVPIDSVLGTYEGFESNGESCEFSITARDSHIYGEPIHYNIDFYNYWLDTDFAMTNDFRPNSGNYFRENIEHVKENGKRTLYISKLHWQTIQSQTRLKFTFVDGVITELKIKRRGRMFFQGIGHVEKLECLNLVKID